MRILNLLDFKPKIEDFAADLIKGFARAGYSGWTCNADYSSLQHVSGGVINLPNLFQEYVNAARTDRSRFLHKYIEFARASMLEVPRQWANAADGIHAVVRSQHDYTVIDIERRGGDSRPPTVTWPFIGDLCVRLVYDFGANVSHVKDATMNAWAQPDDVVRSHAIDNLRRLPRPTWQALGAGVYRLISEASYAESFLLIDDIVDELAFKESLVAIPCNRGILLAADGTSETALLAMIDEAQRCLQDKPWPLSGTLCTRDRGHWQEFRPRGDEVTARAHGLQIVNLAGVYNDQQTALDDYHQKIGRDVFVATYGVVKRRERLLSWCTWTEGVPALLARTDVVAFRRLNGIEDTLLLSWDNVVALIGHRLQPTTEVPLRFFVETFPENVEWEAMKAVRMIADS